MEQTKSNLASEKTMISATGELVAQNDSRERMNISLVTRDAKELYEELKKMRYSIEMAFENTEISSDMVDGKPRPVS
jgi:hypothetical protein